MSRMVSLILLFAVIGLVVGYFLFAKVGGGYVRITSLIAPDESTLAGLVQKVRGIPQIRTNILISGAVGAGVGLLLSVARGRRG